MKSVLKFIVLAIFLSSCSSVKSVESPNKLSSDGLTYYMPKKDFLVTISVRNGEIQKVSLGTTTSYPDISTQYILRHSGNLFGDNTLNIGINKKGLLVSSKSTTVSKVTESFKNLATSMGQMKASRGDEKSISRVECSTDGDHTFIYEKSGEYSACDISINIIKPQNNLNIITHSKNKSEPYSGIFYRQNEPYLITAKGSGLNISSIVFSPSESKTHFLSISKTFFSDNDADFAFDEGVPTKYTQKTEAELIALLKLPAEVLSSYFGAIGTMFDSLKSNESKETDALNQSLKLELAKKKYEACISAIKSGDDELIEKLGCR